VWWCKLKSGEAVIPKRPNKFIAVIAILALSNLCQRLHNVFPHRTMKALRKTFSRSKGAKETSKSSQSLPNVAGTELHELQVEQSSLPNPGDQPLTHPPEANTTESQTGESNGDAQGSTSSPTPMPTPMSMSMPMPVPTPVASPIPEDPIESATTEFKRVVTEFKQNYERFAEKNKQLVRVDVQAAIDKAASNHDFRKAAVIFGTEITTTIKVLETNRESSKAKWTGKLSGFLGKLYPVARLSFHLTSVAATVTFAIRFQLT